MTSATMTSGDGASEASSFAVAEDFQAIGLRPMEFRLGVIRGALKRLALPLATLHLSDPTPPVEEKLVKIAMTGYRLLDPRRREDSIQRMLLGRIHLQLADEAVRLAQSKARAPVTEEGETQWDAGGGKHLATGRAIAGHLHSTFLADDVASPWSLSLRSHDLLVPRLRGLGRLRRWAPRTVFKNRFLSVNVGIALLGLTLATWKMLGTSTDEIAAASFRISPPAASVIALPKAVSETVLVREKTAAAKSSAEAKPVAPVPPSTSLTVVVADVISATEAPTADPLVPAEAELMAKREPAEKAVGPGVTTSVPIVSLDQVSATVPQATSSPRFPTPARVPAPKVRPRGGVVSVEAVSPELGPWPVPRPDELAPTIETWEAAVADISKSDWSARLAVAERFTNEVSKGPWQAWIGLHRSALYAVLAAKFDVADVAMLRISDRYDVAFDDVATGLADELGLLARIDSDISNVVVWLGTARGRALQAGHLDEAERFALIIATYAKDRNDTAAIERSKEFAKAILLMRRFEAKAVEIESGAIKQPTASDRFSAGRYWALVRRDWVKALPLLATGSDTRVASLATSETLTSGMPEVDEINELASGYLAVASKNSSWLADSYLLHASDILATQVAHASNIESLERTRKRDELRKDNAPAFLLSTRMTLPKFPAAPIASETKHLLSPNEQPNSLAGRILVHGNDVGLKLDYQLGVVFSSAMIAQIEKRIGENLSDASLEMVGTIVVDRPTAVAIHVSGRTDDEQTILVDGQPLGSVSGPIVANLPTQTYRVDLLAGLWTLRWNTSKLSGGLSLQVIDALSGSELPVSGAMTDIDEAETLAPSRLRVSVTASR